MTLQPHVSPGIERATQALLALIESDRAGVCERILGAARDEARGLHANAHAGARTRMRQVFEEQRARRRERIAAAEARLATERRLHEQKRLVAWLRMASEQLAGELQELWRQDEARATWTRAVLAAARARLPPGRWRIAHADWPEHERERVVREAAPEAIPCCEADPGIAAGLKVASGGIVLDGTLEGLLVDRADFESRLLRRLEARP